ncbi:DsbA family protein [Paenibacillus filicis]|uniref:DsbA family protein n=1 Tax=Paenibacillus filicis TaxID=669464 RepID=A0ABU9DCK2_9BACL
MNSTGMVCNMETGICGEASEAGEGTLQLIDLSPPRRKAKLYYVTDPICSHCWALEPVLRKFKWQYEQYIDVHIVMGGLLESWDGFADASNGISKPADVAGHWKEVGEHSRMPIDGSLWLNDPIRSSYPPSRVFKTIQQTDERLARLYLRRAREAVFAFNRNIGEESMLEELVRQIGLDGAAVVEQSGTSSAMNLLEEDFALARSLGVRGFPTIVMVNEEHKGVKIVGARPLESYVAGLAQVLSGETLQAKALPSLPALLDQEQLLFSRELEVMYDLEHHEIEAFVQDNLPAGSYALKEMLGELYVERI